MWTRNRLGLGTHNWDLDQLCPKFSPDTDCNADLVESPSMSRLTRFLCIAITRDGNHKTNPFCKPVCVSPYEMNFTCDMFDRKHFSRIFIWSDALISRSNLIGTTVIDQLVWPKHCLVIIKATCTWQTICLSLSLGTWALSGHSS